MAQDLGLCEGCVSWEELAEDSRNGEFNNKCLVVLLEWYEANRVDFKKRRGSYERRCKEEIQEVYRVARELVKWAKESVLYDDPSVSRRAITAKGYITMEGDEEDRMYTIIRGVKDKAIELEKRCAERGCSVLYQLLSRLDEFYKVNGWLRGELCERLEGHFSNKDSGFFNMLSNRLYSPDEDERLIQCINTLLAKRERNSRGGEGLLFSCKSHWKAVYEALHDRKLAIARQQEGFARFIADNDNVIYADENQRIEGSSNIRNARETLKGKRVRSVFETLLDEAGL